MNGKHFSHISGDSSEKYSCQNSPTEYFFVWSSPSWLVQPVCDKHEGGNWTTKESYTRTVQKSSVHYKVLLKGSINSVAANQDLFPCSLDKVHTGGCFQMVPGTGSAGTRCRLVGKVKKIFTDFRSDQVWIKKLRNQNTPSFSFRERIRPGLGEVKV